MTAVQPSAGEERSGMWEQALFYLVLLLGLVVRLYRLGVPSIWYDEGVSLYLAGQSLPAMLAHTAGDIHPPLYYTLLHVWTRLAGSSEFAAGAFSLVFGLLLIPLVYRLGKGVADAGVGLIAAFLVAVSPYNIWYSQELRMYTLGACLGLLALLGLRAAQRVPGSGWRGWLLYALAAAAGMYTLYYFVFLLLALALWSLLAIAQSPAPGRGRLFLRWAGAQAAALALYAPWLPTAIRQALNPPVPPWRTSASLGEMLVESWSALSFGQSVEPAQVWPLLVLVAFLAALGLWSLARRSWIDAAGVAGAFVLPWAAIAMLSAWVPLYHVRYMFTYSPPFYVLLAAGVVALARHTRTAGPLALVALLLGSGFSLWQYHEKPAYAEDDHRAAVRYIEARWRPGDAVLINAGYVYPPYVYYNELPIAWRGRLSNYGTAFSRADAPAGLALLQTGTVDGPASLGWGSPASDFYAISRSETAAALERVFHDYERVWIYRCYDTVTDPDGTIRSWLDEHGVKFDETPAFAGASNLRVQGYLTRRDLPTGLPAAAIPLNIRYGDQLELVGIDGMSSELRAGEPLDVVLWWRAERVPLPRLAITVRLADESGQVWEQEDERPLGSLFDTTAWPAGGLVRHALRLGLPDGLVGLVPGVYHVDVGVYESDAAHPWLTATGRQLANVAEYRSAGDVTGSASVRSIAVFGEQIELLRLGGASGPLLAGRALNLTLEWRARRQPDEDYVAFVQLLDREGMPVAMQESAPANGRFPTRQWVAGQVVDEKRSLHVPADTPAGTYRLIVGWYRPADGRRLELRSALPWGQRDAWQAARLEVTSRAALRILPEGIWSRIDAPMGAGIELVGYQLGTNEVRAGGHLPLRLLWQRAGLIDRDYTVFCHLVDETGAIWGQADGAPAGGEWPTLTWMSEEYVVDEQMLVVRADAPSGDYALLVGMYEPASGARPGEPIEVATIRVVR